ncbi:uncharacterized protein EV420DRAFT_1734165 [Desarmillaria tabescens]|uniref:Uncharacterized protein n=1 Tax=Armillaria tabescens TaxID=1929756 RepID=A0AA39JDF4_ARMTA|nr:uncharacterized protein EV420DRAFT_1734165 [Desarmillaria tabescens]KAK0439299.1 hypothetical protein EV420DRAFT_1734165 [Desarmillaria tabescens]
MPEDPYAFFNAPARPRKLAPLTKQRHWRTMSAAIKNRRMGKLAIRPENIPKKRLDETQSQYRLVPASPGNTPIHDSEAENQYNGPSTWDFMTLEIDMSNGMTAIFDELERFRTSFGVRINSLKLRSGLRETREALEQLEELADWIDEADLRSQAEEEHQRLWKGWSEYVERENAQLKMEKDSEHGEPTEVQGDSRRLDY